MQYNDNMITEYVIKCVEWSDCGIIYYLGYFLKKKREIPQKSLSLLPEVEIGIFWYETRLLATGPRLFLQNFMNIIRFPNNYL
jgi:hypothetical protein